MSGIDLGGGPDSLLALFRAGGWPMYLLAATLFALLFFCFSALENMGRRHLAPDNALGEILVLLKRGDVQGVHRQLIKSSTVLARVFLPILAKTQLGMDSAERQQADALAQTYLQREQAVLFRPIQYINAVAAVAPMLGLLGTVWSMIGAFHRLSEGGVGNAQLMAGDISMGLITTAAGLLIAIPAFILYWVLRSRLQERLYQLADVVNQMLDALQAAESDDSERVNAKRRAKRHREEPAEDLAFEGG